MHHQYLVQEYFCRVHLNTAYGEQHLKHVVQLSKWTVLTMFAFAVLNL